MWAGAVIVVASLRMEVMLGAIEGGLEGRGVVVVDGGVGERR